MLYLQMTSEKTCSLTLVIQMDSAKQSDEKRCNAHRGQMLELPETAKINF